MQAEALSLAQKNSLQTLVDFVCLQLLFKVLLTLDGKLFCHSYSVNLSNNVVCVWSKLNLTVTHV